MSWNWELPEWPKFQYDPSKIASLEKEFLLGAGGSHAILNLLDDQEKKQAIVDILSAEGVKSAEIEGEVLNRESLQSSIKNHFGLNTDKLKTTPQELGMAELMWTLYETFNQELTHEEIWSWHKKLMGWNTTLECIGKYRTHSEPMQIVSGRYERRTLNFEAPPSKTVYFEMERFIQWFNSSRKGTNPLARAAHAHVYFESIHPFEDGNGRIGRALVEKSLSQSLNQPTLIALSDKISQNKKEYYNALGTCNRSLNMDSWLTYFSKILLEAQQEAYRELQFLIAKAKLLQSLKGTLNERQEKVLLRILMEGPKGFAGGLSAENYISITKASRATATRDLADLVERGVLEKSGQLKHTRYYLRRDFQGRGRSPQGF